MKITKKRITNFILLVLAVVVFIIIGVKTDWEKTIQSISSAKPFWLVSGAGFMIFAHWIRGIRWTLLTEPAGYTLNKRRAFYSVMAGYLVNVATSRGGEIARCALTAKSEKTPVELLIGTVVTERLVDFAMFLLVCLAALLFQFEYILSFLNKWVIPPISEQLTLTNFIVLFVVLTAVAAVWVIYKKRKVKKAAPDTKGIKGIVLRFAAGLKTIFNLKAPYLFLLYSFVIWLAYWFSTYCILHSLNVTESLTLLNALSVVIFATIGIAIPLPAGAGVWGAVTIGLHTVYGISEAAAETYAIFTLAVSNLIMIVIGAISYLLLYLEMQKLEKYDVGKNTA